jgi:hypothetical protein
VIYLFSGGGRGKRRERDLRDVEKGSTFLSLSLFDESEFFRLRERFQVGRVEGEGRFVVREWGRRTRGRVFEESVEASTESSRFSLFEVKLSPEDFVFFFEILHSRRFGRRS